MLVEMNIAIVRNAFVRNKAVPGRRIEFSKDVFHYILVISFRANLLIINFTGI